MIQLRFKVTEKRGESRDLLVRIHEPFRISSEEKWPWAVSMDVDERRYVVTGVDPLDVVESGARHAAILLHILYGDALDPILEPRA
jgi:hypothetical protein